MGSGYRTFTAGEILTASNVQNYLQDQVVMTFGGSAARSSAIGTANFEEGMTSYLTDTDKLEVYNGTNWVNVAPVSASGLTLINTTSFSAVASQAFDSVFSATYDNYFITVTMTTASSPTLTMVMRTGAVDNTTSNYWFQRFEASNTLLTGTRTTTGASWGIDTQTDQPKSFVMEILNPFTSTTNTFLKNFANTAGYFQLGGAKFNGNTSFDGFKIICSTGSMTGTAKIYGLAN
jgi:hypothetical protein